MLGRTERNPIKARRMMPDRCKARQVDSEQGGPGKGGFGWSSLAGVGGETLVWRQASLGSCKKETTNVRRRRRLRRRRRRRQVLARQEGRWMRQRGGSRAGGKGQDQKAEATRSLPQKRTREKIKIRNEVCGGWWKFILTSHGPRRGQMDGGLGQ